MQSIRHYLEYQADRAEAVLAAHRTPGRVTGGTVGPRVIRFFLNPAPHVRYASIKRLADDLALAMRVSSLAVSRGKDGVVLEFSNPDPKPVELATLLPEVQPLPVATTVLGLEGDGTPVLARLSSPEVAHILVAGTTGSGKSVLLRELVASLIMGNRSDVLKLIAIDPKGRTLPKGFTTPHFARPIITDAAQAVEVLLSLVRMMELRDKRGELPDDTTIGRGVPRVVVVIDELADLVLQQGSKLTEPLARLLQRGREAGIHIVAATQRPSAAILSGLMRANFPLRLVGRVVSADDARIASGRGGSNAHMLGGRGDFLAIAGADDPIRFQVAYISRQELQRFAAPVTPSLLPADTGTLDSEFTEELSPQAFALPVVEADDEQEEAEGDDIELLAQRLGPWWEEYKGRTRGKKTKALEFLWPRTRHGGWHWDTLDLVLERLGVE